MRLIAKTTQFVRTLFIFVILCGSNSVLAQKERYTVVLLPPLEVGLALEQYARLAYFDKFALDKAGNPLYRLGVEPNSLERKRAHITVAQFEQKSPRNPTTFIRGLAAFF